MIQTHDTIQPAKIAPGSAAGRPMIPKIEYSESIAWVPATIPTDRSSHPIGFFGRRQVTAAPVQVNVIAKMAAKPRKPHESGVVRPYDAARMATVPTTQATLIAIEASTTRRVIRDAARARRAWAARYRAPRRADRRGRRRARPDHGAAR